MAHPYYGSPSGCPAHCTPSAMYMAHPYYVPGTPILWHDLHTVQTPRSDAPFRRPFDARDALLPSLARTRCPCTHTFGAWKGVLAAVACR